MCKTQLSSQTVEKEVWARFYHQAILQPFFLRQQHLLVIIIVYGSEAWLALAWWFSLRSLVWGQAAGGELEFPWRLPPSHGGGNTQTSAACCWLSPGAQRGLSAGTPTHGPCFAWAPSMAAGFQGWAAQETVKQMLYLLLYFSFRLHVMSPPTSFSLLDPGDQGQFTFKGRKINLMLHFFMGVVSENLWEYFKSTHHGNSQSRKLWEASRYCRGGWLSI